MAKTVKERKAKGLDIVIGDMIVNHVKKMLTNKKPQAPQKVKVYVKKSKPKVDPKPKITKTKTAPASTPELKVVEPEASVKPAEVQEPKKSIPYKRINIASGDIKRTKETGEYIHPSYSFGKKFHHEGDPHTGTVTYVATFSSGGEPLVQPIDEHGQNVGKTFQADPSKLSEK